MPGRIPQPDQADDDHPLALLLGENGRAWMTEVSQNYYCVGCVNASTA